MKCSSSLWSADLSNLADEIKRVEPYSERFHLDVADGHYVNVMLFFPDLVAACRPHTSRPFEVHLIVADPLRWIDPFADAGADVFVFYLDIRDDPRQVIERIKGRGKEVGISLKPGDSIDLLDPYWDELSMVCMVGTDIGTKGVANVDPRCLENIRLARQLIDQRDLSCEIEADGAIRRHTVPELMAAGTDYIVPGSLMFKENPAELRVWLDGL